MYGVCGKSSVSCSSIDHSSKIIRVGRMASNREKIIGKMRNTLYVRRIHALINPAAGIILAISRLCSRLYCIREIRVSEQGQGSASYERCNGARKTGKLRQRVEVAKAKGGRARVRVPLLLHPALLVRRILRPVRLRVNLCN